MLVVAVTLLTSLMLSQRVETRERSKMQGLCRPRETDIPLVDSEV